MKSNPLTITPVGAFVNGWLQNSMPGRGLCYPWVVFGFGNIAMANVETGEVIDLGRGFPFGPLTPTTVAYCVPARDERGAEVDGHITPMLYDLVERKSTPWGIDADLAYGNGQIADKGHWATGKGRGRIVYDGQVLTTDDAFPWALDLDGDELVVARGKGDDWSTHELVVFKAGVEQRRMKAGRALQGFRIRNGWVGVGYGGDPWLHDPSGVGRPCAVTAWKNEGCPHPVAAPDGTMWIWTACEHPIFPEHPLFGHGVVMGRPAYAQDCIIAPLMACNMDVQAGPNGWVVAGNNDTGGLSVIEIPYDTPRRRVPVPPAWRDIKAHVVYRQVGNLVDATAVLEPGGGDLRDIRFVLDTLDGTGFHTHKPGDGKLTHQFILPAGSFKVGAHVWGINGVEVWLNSFDATTVPSPPPPPPPPSGPRPYPEEIRAIVAGFGECLGPQLQPMLDRRWNMIRNDLVSSQNPQGCVAEIEASPAFGFYIVSTLEQLRALPRGVWADWRNEPDLNGPSSVQYAAEVVAALAVAKQRGITLFVGSVSNFNERGLAFLRTLIEKVPSVTHLSPHYYPNDACDPEGRETAVAEFKRIIGNRKFLIGEEGYHRAPRRVRRVLNLGFLKIPLWKRTLPPLTAVEQRDRLRTSAAFWKAQGALGMFVYQRNCAPGDAMLANYGLWDAAGQPTVSADLWM